MNNVTITMGKKRVTLYKEGGVFVECHVSGIGWVEDNNTPSIDDTIRFARERISEYLSVVKSDRPSLTNDVQIGLYMHCQMCLEEKPDDVSPRDWARCQVGFTKLGLQVVCARHNVNVCHIDFEGYQHPADTTCSQDAECVKEE